jgi:dipeptidyl-peptidase-4
MTIRDSLPNLILAWMPLALTLGVADTLIAQSAQVAAQLTVERVAEEREANKVLPHNLVWYPNRKALSFIRSIPTSGKSPHAIPASEILSIDAVTGQQKPLVSSEELRAAFGAEHNRAPISPSSDDAERSGTLQSYAWAPGGHALLLATTASLAWFDLDTRSSRRLVTGNDILGTPEISPDGRFVSFIRDHALWLVDLPNGAVHAFSGKGSSDQLEGEPDWVYSHELGLHTAYWWSPDSSSIAWIETDDRAVAKYSLRSTDGDEQSIAYPKPAGAIPTIHIFVQAVSGGNPLEIDLGSDKNVYIPRVMWLPDSKHLAVERLTRSQKALDLLLADSSTGASHVILTEKDAYWINLSDVLYFLKDSTRFVWSSERSGFRHLYLYDLAGRQLAQLTQGNWEVTSLDGVDEVAGAVYFTGTEASPLERQFYRANLDGSGFTRITKEKGTHDIRFLSDVNVFVDAWSNHETPLSLRLLHADGSEFASLSDNPPGNAAVNPLSLLEFISVKTHLGMDLNAWMMKPPDFNLAKQYPVILYVAGGPGEQIVRDAWGGDLSLWFSLMAHRGYVVLAIDNRGSAGRGHLFEEPIHLRFSGTEMADLRDGVMYLNSQPWIDKTRIGICGWGYGGFLALHGMLDRPLLFKAGFAGSPITDWHLYDAVFAERYLEDPVRNQDGWLNSSPLENAKNLRAPLLLAQATLDDKVHLENSLMLLDELLDKGKYADILLFPDRRNLFDDHRARLILFQRLTDFFVKNL